MGNVIQNKWVLLIILALTWGSSFILIKKSLDVFNPFQIGAIRIGVSGLILMRFGLPALLKMSRNTLLWLGIAGFFGCFFPMFLFPIAQTHVSSSLAGILDSLVPIFVLVLGFLIFGIKSKWLQVIGAITGFIGAAALMWFSETRTEESVVGYALLIVLATASYAFSALLIKHKLQHVPSIQLSTGVFTFWMIPSLVILLVTGFFQDFQSTSETWTALGYLSILTIVGTAIAIVLYYKLIQDTSPVFASTVTYLLPLVAVFWGLLDGEKFTIWYVFGGILILVGIYLIREKKKEPRHIPR